MFRNLSSGLDHNGTELTLGSRLNALMAYDTAFEGHHREIDISLGRRARALSRTTRVYADPLPACRQVQLDKLIAPRPAPLPWVPFKWGTQANDSVTPTPQPTQAPDPEQSPLPTQNPTTAPARLTIGADPNKGTTPPLTRPRVAGPHSHFTIHVAFPEDDIDDQYILVHSALLVTELKSQLGAYLAIASATVYVTPYWQRLHQHGTISDPVVPETTIPCPYLEKYPLVRVQRPPVSPDISTRSPASTPIETDLEPIPVRAAMNCVQPWEIDSPMQSSSELVPPPALRLSSAEFNELLRLCVEDQRRDRLGFKNLILTQWQNMIQPSQLHTPLPSAPFIDGISNGHTYVVVSEEELQAEAFELYRTDYMTDYNTEEFKLRACLNSRTSSPTTESPQNIRSRMQQLWATIRNIYFIETDAERHVR